MEIPWGAAGTQLGGHGLTRGQIPICARVADHQTVVSIASLVLSKHHPAHPVFNSPVVAGELHSISRENVPSFKDYMKEKYCSLCYFLFGIDFERGFHNIAHLVQTSIYS